MDDRVFKFMNSVPIMYIITLAAIAALTLSVIVVSEMVFTPLVPPITITPSPSPTASTEFPDDQFRVQSASKGAIAFDNQYLDANTTVTCIMPNTDTIFPATPNASSLVVPLTGTLTVTGLKNTIYGIQPGLLDVTGINNVFFGYNSASDVSNVIQLGEAATVSDVINFQDIIVVTDNTFTLALTTANQGFFCNAFRNDDTPTNYLTFNDSTYEMSYTLGFPGQALTRVNDTNVTVTLGGSPTTALFAATQITVNWTGSLSTDRGGTGQSNTPLVGAILTSNTTSFPLTNSGLDAYYLQSRGSSLAPNWVCYGTSFGTGTSTDSFGQSITTLSQTQTGNSALISVGNGTLSGANTAFGAYTLTALTDVAGNVSNCGFGYRAGASLVVGADNVFWGEQSAGSLLGGTKNICFGSYAMGGSTSTTASSNIAFGFNTLGAVGFNSSYNIAIGDSALNSLTTGSYNIGIGDNMLPALTTGSYNIGMGGSNTLLALVDGSRNVVVGVAAQTSASATTLNDVTAMGYGSLAANTSTSVTVFGVSALAAGGSASSFTTAFGYQANALNTSLRGCVFGYNTAGASSVRTDMTLLSSAGVSVVQGGGASTGTAIGLSYGQQGTVTINTFITTAGNINGVCMGISAAVRAVRDFVAFGYKAMQNISATSNSPPAYVGISIGSFSNQGPNGSATDAAVMVGYNLAARLIQFAVLAGTNIPYCVAIAIGNNISTLATSTTTSAVWVGNNMGLNITGSSQAQSTLIGSNNLSNITTDASTCLFIGHSLNTTNTSCHDSCCIGMGSICTADRQIRIGFGTESNQSCYIDGISGITTGVADAVNVLIDVNGQLGTVSSSRRYKTNIHSLQNRHYENLQPVSYFEKRDQNHTTKLYSFIAEEVATINKNLVCFRDDQPYSIHLQYFPIIMLIIMKQLHTKMKGKEEKLRRLKFIKSVYLQKMAQM